MKPVYQIHVGDSLKVLRTLPSHSVHCAITSPPYLGLRDYGAAGQIGREGSIDGYLDALVDVFREVRRVLKSDGSLWLNLGDTYSAGEAWGSGVKKKDLCGIPWRAALALQSDGWHLRSDCIWEKPNCLPESVRDRPTKSHEYLFLLTPTSQYYYDQDAIREPVQSSTIARYRNSTDRRTKYVDADDHVSYIRKRDPKSQQRIVETGRNRRTVWRVATAGFKGSHFATFPVKLVEPCVLASCPPDGTVLDPFSGAATTGVAALRNGRNYVGIELNPEFAALSKDRLESTLYSE